MTSKEALERLVGKTSILNDTCASLEDCIKCGKCRYNEPCETCDDYNLVMTIKKSLEKLEEINEIWHKNEPLESVDINGNHLQELYDFRNKLIDDNTSLHTENESLHTKCESLQSENKNLKEEMGMYIDTNNNLYEENKKLKKVIEILKDTINSYLKTLYSKEYIETHIKGKYSNLGIANRNGQEKALNTILELLKEYL